MNIAQFDSKISLPNLDIISAPEKQENTEVKSESFMDILMGAIGEVNSVQKNAETSAENLALGDESYLHNTVIAYEKANLALLLTVEVRNRIMEAYQEIMRIQM